GSEVRTRTAGYHQGLAGYRVVHLRGLLPGDHASPDRSGGNRQAGLPAGSEGKRGGGSSDPGRYRSELPREPQEAGTGTSPAGNGIGPRGRAGPERSAERRTGPGRLIQLGRRGRSFPPRRSPDPGLTEGWRVFTMRDL